MLKSYDPVVKPKFSIYTKDNHFRDKTNAMFHMFTEDMHIGVLPISGESKNYPDFKSDIIGDRTSCENIKNLLNTITQFEERYNITKLICNSVNDISRYLFYEGILRYEIVRTSIAESNFHLFYFPNKYTHHLLKYYIQYIPVNKRLKKDGGFNVLKEEEVFTLKIPDILGGVRIFKKIESALNNYDLIGPRFFLNNPDFNSNPYFFDFNRYVYHYEIFVHKITNKYGWYRRDTSTKIKTEFYFFYRLLNFKWVKSIIREYIISELNKLFMRLNIGAKIEITGIPSSEKLLKMKEDFINGKIKLETLSEKLWF